MLNEKAERIYNYIKDSIDDGYPPTIREICQALNIRSTSTVHRYINELAEEGYIEKNSSHNRAIRITGRKNISVPLLGEVAAGTPIFAVENISDYISFNSERRYSGDLFALKVKGDSMINIGIFSDDIIIAEQTSYAENGDIVVALVDDENATVKTFYREKGYIRLQPENDEMKPIISKNVKILGKVAALIRYF